MHFGVRSIKFPFVARKPVYFPPGKAGNVLRGSFGFALDGTAFAPEALSGPSGFRDPPRPFVFRVAGLRGPMEQFDVGLNLFDVELTAAVIAAMAEVARVGLGPTRRTFELRSDPEVLDHEFDLSPLTASVEKVNVRFVTPTELKVAGGMAPKPDFEVLMSRIRDRVSNLRSLYGPGPLEIDFRGFAERAAKVSMLWFEMQQVDIMRHSSRTGRSGGVHPIPRSGALHGCRAACGMGERRDPHGILSIREST
jgi:hypothetical protein